MIEIYTSKKYFAEKKYVIKTFLSYFDISEYQFFVHERANYRISIDSNREIVFSDSFFSKIIENYLQTEYLPEKPIFIQNIFTPEADLPILFGDDDFLMDNYRIHCGADIFASAFFMLTRWEEYVLTERDRFGRFPDEKSYVQKNNLHYRPIVNEYIEMLRRMLVYLGVSAKISQKYTVVPTHDVDFVFRLNRFPKFIKAFSGDILKRKNIGEALKTTLNYIKGIFNSKSDPYNTFLFLSEISKKNGAVSRFYFMPSYAEENESEYDIRNPKVEKIIHELSENGCIIGIHGTVSAHKNSDKFGEEKKRLEHIIQPITECRTHFLRFDIPKTFRIFEENNILTDSSLSFSADGGFRCGICFEYQTFDILKRKELNVWEMPLIVMETALRKKYPSPNEFYSAFKKLSETVKKYQGDFVFLWHNSNLNVGIWKDYKKIYPQLVREISNQKP
jgi:hypothetical protein